jgi:hypothetical protein
MGAVWSHKVLPTELDVEQPKERSSKGRNSSRIHLPHVSDLRKFFTREVKANEYTDDPLYFLRDLFQDPFAIIDNKIPLTIRQKYTMCLSWKRIIDDMEIVGVRLFMNLFHENPELKVLFSKFGHLVTDRELQDSEAMKKHAVLVMTTIDTVMTLLEDTHELSEILQKLVNKHTIIPGFHKGLLVKIRSPFLDAVKETLGEEFTLEQQYMYQTFIDCVIKIMTECCEYQKCHR